ncbi:MAG: AhpC/TSA family protein, partial [Bacteroidales bacterium]|nr:AhpC/TSA family protein [Bacteroidales bacterium]
LISRYYMKETIIYKLLPLFTLSILFFSCKDKKQEFTISGEITNANNKTLYLEHVGISRITLVDSAQLNSEKFKFKQERPKKAPDFYRLRLGNQMINLAVDSTETIYVKSNANTFATEYTLDEKGTKNKNIQELTLLQIKTRKEYNDLVNQFDANQLTNEEFKEKAYATINQYKDKAKEFIGQDFKSAVAYFALFQQINNLLIFNPYDKEDNKLFGALANSWNIHYPESDRAVQLKNLYVNAKASFREINPLVLNEASGKTLFDINLPDINNKEIRMSEACKGKVTIIDFTAYSMEGSPTHNLLLAELYRKYKEKGLEIYQVSLDADNHIWKNAAVNLPWICVIDPQSLYSDVATLYNVADIPTTFVMNREGEIVFRVENYVDLEKEVVKYLK